MRRPRDIKSYLLYGVLALAVIIGMTWWEGAKW